MQSWDHWLLFVDCQFWHASLYFPKYIEKEQHFLYHWLEPILSFLLISYLARKLALHATKNTTTASVEKLPRDARNWEAYASNKLLLFFNEVLVKEKELHKDNCPTSGLKNHLKLAITVTKRVKTRSFMSLQQWRQYKELGWPNTLERYNTFFSTLQTQVSEP